MSTHAIGKLKYSLSGRGLAFQWGDGKTHRLFQGKKAPGDEEYLDDLENAGEADFQGASDAGEQADYADDPGYDEADYADDPGYDEGDYADDPGYDEGDYADDPGYKKGGSRFDDGDYDDRYDDDQYDDDRYADEDGYDDRYDDEDGYDDDRYADEDYDDDRYDEEDGYDDGRYDDEGYDDRYDDGYDDRYLDEDADGYGAEGDGYGEQSALMRYVDENDWVTYLLLFLFPPLGIYLLWRRNRFDKPVRWAITAASAIWFVVALILLLHGLFGGSGDRQTQATITIPPLTATATIAPAETDTAGTSTGSLLDNLDAQASPSPTPLAGGVTGTTDTASGDYVYSPATGLYYHSYENCPNIPDGVSVWRVTLDIAQNSRHQSACPECIGGGTGTTYYGTKGGKYYHLDSTCSGMQNATTYTKEAAEKEGKAACPVCVTKSQSKLSSAGTSSGVFIKSSTVDKSGIYVYATKSGEHYHIKKTCSGMTDAVRGPLKAAILYGKTPCPTCCSAAGKMVWCTEKGNSYHLDKSCQGMKGAKQVTLAEALVLGKTQCGKCIKSSLMPSVPTEATSATDDEMYVYATEGGKYYHINSTCSGMKNASRVTLRSMLLANRKPCPVCASLANTKVYATKGGTYYHSYATCSDMKNASSGTLAQAIAAGYKKCPKCWGSKATGTTSSSASSSSGSSSSKASAAKSTATASNTYVYATREGTYYHTKSNCSGMNGASRITLKTAISAGKKACPTCAAAANYTVYSTKDGKYYHRASSCEKSGMKKGTKRTLAEALMMNQTACPDCMTASAAKAAASSASSSAAAASSTFKSGTSGIRVYATLSGKYYHVNRSCAGSGASRVTLETALNYGKKACPKCASSANRTVYATRGGKYYHYSKSDAGSGAKRGTLAAALAYGFDPCPNCVTRTSGSAAKTTFKSGTSGIKVYATLSSKYYHSKADCSGLTDAKRVTLETALNYGKKACPVCLSAANTKVYARSGDKYYHYFKAHAGSGATAGTIAAALAYGLKACPQCTTVDTGSQTVNNGGSVGAPVSTNQYAASADSVVYIDPGSANNYYHKGSKCGSAGFSGGTKVTLQYVKDWGYKACPYCQPPTSIAAES